MTRNKKRPRPAAPGGNVRNKWVGIFLQPFVISLALGHYRYSRPKPRSALLLKRVGSRSPKRGCSQSSETLGPDKSAADRDHDRVSAVIYFQFFH